MQDVTTGLPSMHGATGTLAGAATVKQELEAMEEQQPDQVTEQERIQLMRQMELAAEEQRQIEHAKEMSVTQRGSSSSSGTVISTIPQHPGDIDEIRPDSDHPERSRRRGRKAESTQAGQELDLTGFDLRQTVQLLGSQDERAIRRTLRTLHIRYSHCSAEKLKGLLIAAGVQGPALRLIQGIVDTCPVCKEWRRRGNRTIATSSTLWKFNDKVEHDLLFVEAQRTVPPREDEKGSATLIRRTGPVALAVKREQFHASQEQYTNDLTTLASNVIDNTGGTSQIPASVYQQYPRMSGST